MSVALGTLLSACDDGKPDRETPDPCTLCPPQQRAWYQFGFESPVLNEVALFYLGHAWDQSADVGEVLETVGRIDEEDPESWMREWRATAERLSAQASKSEQAGHRLSASQAYLRAATYYRAALHHAPAPTAPEVPLLA